MGFLKYLPLILKGKSVADTYKQETGKDKPVFVSRRFIGAVVVFIGAAASMYFGVPLDENILSFLADNVMAAISASIALYGAVLGIVGIIKRKK